MRKPNMTYSRGIITLPSDLMDLTAETGATSLWEFFNTGFVVAIENAVWKVSLPNIHSQTEFLAARDNGHLHDGTTPTTQLTFTSTVMNTTSTDCWHQLFNFMAYRLRGADLTAINLFFSAHPNALITINFVEHDLAAKTLVERNIDLRPGRHYDNLDDDHELSYNARNLEDLGFNQNDFELNGVLEGDELYRRYIVAARKAKSERPTTKKNLPQSEFIKQLLGHVPDPNKITPDDFNIALTDWIL